MEAEISEVERGKQEAKKQRIYCKLQVAEVRKPLMAVKRIVEKGNLVQFGDLPGESYIYITRKVRARFPYITKAEDRT